MRYLAPTIALLAACQQERIDVAPGDPKSDYGHTALRTAIDKFVAAGRTPAAFAELSGTVTALRPGMDKMVADEAELKLLVLALAPVQAAQDKTVDVQAQELALTVWPMLLAPRIEAEALLQVRDPNAPLLVPKPGEDVAAYLMRLCGGPLASECKRVVPEYQAQFIDALALRRATERIRNAITFCMECTSEHADPAWRKAVEAWEGLDRAASEWIVDIERRANPDNWPIAGAASDDDPGLPEAELAPRGDIIVDGHAYGPNTQRITVLRELRGNGDLVALHLYPDMKLHDARGILADARRAGCAKIAVIAREPFYPWRRKAYWLADSYGLRASLRQTDSLQLLLHAIDEVAGPGSIVRVD
jgi:hypothetical protein